MGDFRFYEPIVVKSNTLVDESISGKFEKIRESDDYLRLPTQGRVELEEAYYVARDYKDFCQKVARIMNWYKKVG